MTNLIPFGIVTAAAIVVSLLMIDTIEAFTTTNHGASKAFVNNRHSSKSRINHGTGSSLFVTNDKFDMDELMQRIREENNNPYLSLFESYATATSSSVMRSNKKQEKPEFVYIILFQPNTEEQGIHSIEFPRGSGNNFILAFESQAACDKFSEALKEQQLFDPTPQMVFLDELEDFCETLGVFVQVVPKDVQLTPPLQNVEKFGHNPSLKEQKNMLNYIFEIDADEEEVDETGLDFDFSDFSYSSNNDEGHYSGIWE